MNLLSISVVIPNYNGKSLLEENLPPLYGALNLSGVDYEIIISDDASSDDSIIFLEKNYPEIILVSKKKNEGFSHTVNQGILVATKKLTFILNSDVKLTGDYFSPQLKYFKRENTFGVMGRIIGLNDDSIQDSAKYPAVKNSKILSTVNYLPETFSENLWVPTLFLSGANALIKTDKLKLLQGLDEIYSPFYGEDVDLSLRAWRLGWKCYYEHQSICRHPTSTTIMAYNKKKSIKIISTRNRFIFHSIHLSGYRKTLWNIQLIFQLCVKWATGRNVYYKAFVLFLKKSKEIEDSKKRFDFLLSTHPHSQKTVNVIKEIKCIIKPLKITKF